MLCGDAARLLVDVEHLLRRLRVERLHALAERRRERARVVLRAWRQRMTGATQGCRNLEKYEREGGEGEGTHVGGGLGDAALLVDGAGV